ncbi:MAG: hypothetical protein KOO61_09485 [Spirochaetales bacterium]|nr:hypothetical protein [Spirochaetales bacterium]
MKRSIILVVVTVLVLSGCERVFTTSPLGFLQRNPDSYSDAQKLTFAEDALASGDEAAMAAAFELLADSADPETQLLAVELALGAAGVASVLTTAIAGLSAEDADLDAVIGDALDGFTDADLALLVSAAELLDQADDSVTPTAEQYAFAAIGLIAAAADDAGGVENILSPEVGSDAEAYVEQAGDFLDEAAALLAAEGGSTDILDGFTGLIP